MLTCSLGGWHQYVRICVTVSLILAGAIVCGGMATNQPSEPWFKYLAFCDKPDARVMYADMLYPLFEQQPDTHSYIAVAAGGWCVAIATALSVISGQYYYNSHPGIHMTLVESVFYVSLSRTAWDLCLAWVVIACVFGYGGPVYDILCDRRRS